MATTWIKPTYAHKRYTNKATIKKKIDYITNQDKTILDYGYADGGFGSDDIEYNYNETETEQIPLKILNAVSDYILNPNKTNGNEFYSNMEAVGSEPNKPDNQLITGYECFPEYAAEEFATSMELYEYNTGRTQNENSRLVYHMRQSFTPGEVDPRIANRIGYELALEFTGGNHAFVVATHTDKAHIHNHIIFNAFNLECNGKFKDPWCSGRRDVARISDKLCREYDLSVIEVKQGWRDPYNEWEKKQGITKFDKPRSHRKRLEDIIAICLEKQPKDFNHLLKYLEDYSCIAKKRGNNISITTPFSKKPIRLSSLSWEFMEDEIKRKIEGMQKMAVENMASHNYEIVSSGFKEAVLEDDCVRDDSIPAQVFCSPQSELQLVIDIQNSLKSQNSIGYRKWAEKFNLEQMSQTLIFIEKHQLEFADLQSMATQKPKVLQGIKSEIDVVEGKLQNIALLQRHIGTYGKTKDIYKQYKQINSREQQTQFRRENLKIISDHEDARTYFNEQGYGFKNSENRLPTIKELREQYATLNTEKKIMWTKYHEIKNADKEIENAWANTKAILNVQDEIQIEPQKQKPPKRYVPSL